MIWKTFLLTARGWLAWLAVRWWRGPGQGHRRRLRLRPSRPAPLRTFRHQHHQFSWLGRHGALTQGPLSRGRIQRQGQIGPHTGCKVILPRLHIFAVPWQDFISCPDRGAEKWAIPKGEEIQFINKNSRFLLSGGKVCMYFWQCIPFFPLKVLRCSGRQPRPRWGCGVSRVLPQHRDPLHEPGKHPFNQEELSGAAPSLQHSKRPGWQTLSQYLFTWRNCLLKGAGRTKKEY